MHQLTQRRDGRIGSVTISLTDDEAVVLLACIGRWETGHAKRASDAARTGAGWFDLGQVDLHDSAECRVLEAVVGDLEYQLAEPVGLRGPARVHTARKRIRQNHGVDSP